MAESHVKISQADITAKIDHLAKHIAADYQDKNVLLVGVLKGAYIFLADLSRALYQKGLTDHEIDFLGISSYGHDTESSKNPRITHDLTTDIRSRHVLLVEDIIDTGYSLDALHRLLSQRGPASLKTVVFLSKTARREVSVPIDYQGFEVDGWVEGYGLDSAELHRGRSEVVEITGS
jgi:hypoxanthine phosphoribosyltransferase